MVFMCRVRPTTSARRLTVISPSGTLPTWGSISVLPAFMGEAIWNKSGSSALPVPLPKSNSKLQKCTIDWTQINEDTAEGKEDNPTKARITEKTFPLAPGWQGPSLALLTLEPKPSSRSWKAGEQLPYRISNARLVHPEEALTGYGSTTHQGLSIFCHVLAIHQFTFSFASEMEGKKFLQTSSMAFSTTHMWHRQWIQRPNRILIKGHGSSLVSATMPLLSTPGFKLIHEEVKRTTMTKDRNLGFFHIEHTCNISETPKQGINSGEYYVIWGASA